MWVLGPDFGHGFVGCFLDLLLVAVFNVFVQRAATGRNCAKVLVCCHVLRADITKRVLASKTLMWSTGKLYHCTLLQCEHVILLQPYSLTNGCLQRLHCRMSAADMASSTIWRSDI